MRTTSLILLLFSMLFGLAACSQSDTEGDGDDNHPIYEGDPNRPDGDTGDGDTEDGDTKDGDTDGDEDGNEDGDGDGDEADGDTDGDDTPSDGDDGMSDGDVDGDLDIEEEEPEDPEDPEDPTLCPEGQRCFLAPGGAKVCLTLEGAIPEEATESCDPAMAESCDGNQSCVCLEGDCSAQGGICLERCGACRSGYSCRLLDMDGIFSCKDMENRWPGDVVANCHAGTACPDGTFCYCQRRALGGACENSVCAESCTAAWSDDLCSGENMACGPVPSQAPFVFGCLYGGTFIPDNARRQCFRYDEEKCPSAYSCHCLDGTGIDCHQSVCIRNCGRCGSGETCQKPLQIGKHVCLVGGQAPPGAVTGCGGLIPQASCPQNYTCHFFGGQYVCLQQCSGD